jgi:hypothetical protein
VSSQNAKAGVKPGIFSRFAVARAGKRFHASVIVRMKPTPLHGQPSWRFASDRVSAAITRQGGHLAPVSFRLPHATVEPYSIAPWTTERADRKLIPVLRSLRGDFFCAPFGGNDGAYRGERHPAHGEAATARWKLESLTRTRVATELHLSMRTHVRAGRIDKMVRLRAGETALYCRHVLSCMSGKMNLGHHAMLKFPDAPGSGLISTSPISFAQVVPRVVEQPEQRGYSRLQPGAIFSRLTRVPEVGGGTADLSRYPARRGFEDIAMIVHEATPRFAWTAVTFPQQRYVWFALKDPRVLRSTVFWLSNGGRHYSPWNGRHVNVMGLEDVTSYFDYGLAESARPNSINRRGITTCLQLRAETPLVVNYIMAVAAIPAGWGRVKTITSDAVGAVLRSDWGRTVRVPLDVDFLYSAEK